MTLMQITQADHETRHRRAGEILDLAISAQIRALRREKGWTQEELAFRADLHQAQISEMETDGYSSWTVKTLQKLARAFDKALVIGFEGWAVFITWARVWVEIEDRPVEEVQP